MLVAIVGLNFASLAHAQVVEDDAARALFRLGEADYAQGRFEDALGHFQQAYDLSHRAQLHFNIGQAADRLGDRRRALGAFEAYQRDFPDAPNRGFVESRINVLRREIAAEESAARAATATTAPSDASPSGPQPTLVVVDAPRRRKPIAAWTILGSGGASTILGSVFLALGRHDYNTVTDAADGTTWNAISDAHDRAAGRTATGSTFLSVGTAAAAIGLVLVLRGGGGGDTAALDVRVVGNGLMLRGSF